ncbi:MAG: OmpA family protein [Rhodospirillales bacterium]|nr:OmpA family protein [Rhodospirillales bacterium]
MAQEKIIELSRQKRQLYSPIAVLVTVGLISGCSQVPDAANPVEWYNNSVEFFAGEDNPDENAADTSAPEKKKTEAPAGDTEKFPQLSSVDQQQQRAERRTSGLVADVEGRKYAPAITRQGDAVNALNAPPAPPPVVTSAAPAPVPAPAPEAQPKTPVVTARTNDTSAPAQPRQLPTTGNAQQDNYQDRFAQRLAEIRAEAAKGMEFPALSESVAYAGAGDTVVVSSNGIEAGYGRSAPQPVQVVSSANSQLTYVDKPLGRLSQGAVKVATIRFENGSANLSNRDRQILANVLALKKERGGRIHVVGHASSRTRNTDPVKHKMINFQVSVARADAIAAELMRMGVDRAQLQIDAISDSSPQYLEVMPTGEAGNRRAEIYLES